jgi:hypothetical protein
MICARCHRNIKRAYITSGGMVFGPTCGAIMGLIQAQRRAAKTQPAPVMRFIRITQAHEYSGQVEMFEMVAA